MWQTIQFYAELLWRLISVRQTVTGFLLHRENREKGKHWEFENFGKTQGI